MLEPASQPNRSVIHLLTFDSRADGGKICTKVKRRKGRPPPRPGMFPFLYIHENIPSESIFCIQKQHMILKVEEEKESSLFPLSISLKFKLFQLFCLHFALFAILGAWRNYFNVCCLWQNNFIGLCFHVLSFIVQISMYQVSGGQKLCYVTIWMRSRTNGNVCLYKVFEFIFQRHLYCKLLNFVKPWRDV